MTDEIKIIFDDFPKLSQEARGNARRIVGVTTFWIEGRIKTKMAEPKHGRAYVRKSVSHTASAPGEAPAVDMGALINSVASTFENDGLTGIISTPQEYAPVLEFGGAHVAARPAFVPATEEARQPFISAMERLLPG